ncbi:ZmpA/ZmpB/ZmpC family metallo-endopeptidase-related protein [Prevotella sp. tc2-28]|uniref:ZmpA/ZmpB/ZmpC family metallo-endopeptidase-related protein n=1 Tax=Prevotella sp. tc2-28 TaxID=1761888 RepID=UPI0015A36C45|nr:ZmpA/ZmpB/ZmpC family metallo-endopeptidase-related protein [Prevotella sp. tc2-28]
MARVWLEYAYSIFITTYLRPFSSKRAELERRLVVSMLLMLTLGSGSVWGQVTYQYYAIHNKDNGYLKQVNGGVAVDKTFRYENSHDGNGSSIWVLSSDGYLQQEMYYLNVANDQTLYLSTEKVTKWTIDDTTASGKNYLKPNGSSKFLCADSGPQLKDSPSKYLNACKMTITENGTKWEGPKDVSFTVQSPQLVTYLRTYYIRSIIATISEDDAGTTNSKVADQKDSRCYCSLTYSTTTDANKGTKWDINESGVIYSKQASGDYSVAATYSVAPFDPIALSSHPAADEAVTLKLQPSPFAPDAGKNYLLFYTKDANYRFPYDDGSLNENDAVKTNASRSVLTEPATSPNNNISWKIVRDNEGFYSFRNVNSGRWLRFDGGRFVDGSNYGVIEVGVNGDDTPTGNEYKFRLYKSGTYKNTNTAPTYCILPYSKQYAVYKSDGVATNASVALSVYTTPKVISLNKANDDSKYCIFAYEAENRIYDFTLSGPISALATGDYVFNTTQSYFSKNIKGSPANTRDLEISGSYSDVNFIWQVQGHDGYITVQTPTVSSGKGTQVVTVNSLPSGTSYGKVMVQAKGGTKYSGWKELEFNLYGEPSYTDISSLSEITSSNGYYRLTADVSDAPGVTEFSGFLDGNMHKISSVSAPLFTTLTGTVKNLVLESVSISSGDSDGNTGAIACKANGDARIYNVGILGGSVSGTEYTGGLVGFLDGSARVINCFSYANVSGGTVGGIVGYNNVATTATNLKTMVMNCMFYGEVSGSSIAPIYNGNIITNVGKNAGVSNFNYFRLESSYIQNTDITKVYNCALGAETRFLQRFEFFRNTLNSHRELAAWWATGSMDNKDKMMKWVLEPSQIGSSTPYPILKTPGYYPSVINIDAENASTATERNKGGKLGTLSVTIQSGSGAQFNAPTGASIETNHLDLAITDKDYDHFNFNYYKVQLPYYNDVGTGNYTGNRVVTGWKIVSVTTDGSVSSYNDFTTGDDAPAYNFADRKCIDKDLYSVSGRVFNQGAYWDVPEGVTGITIQPYWAKAAYVADAYPDVVYNANMTEAYDVSNVGGGQKYTNNTNYNIAGEQQRVFTSISEAVTNANGLNKPTGNTVHDYAVVLVGNVHQYTGNNVAIGSNYKYTVTTIDLDHDNEPDYSLMLRNDGRNKLHPAKWDFLNIVGLGMAQKSTGGKGSYNQGIFQPLYWFETTNTSLFRVTQFEYDNTSRIEAPLILQGGVMEQWVCGQSGGAANKTTYFHVGGNVWFKEFHRGTHQDVALQSKHPPVSVTGGDYNEFYLTGLYTANVTSYTDNAECYINGGRFGIVAGAAMEGIGKAGGADDTGNITWQVQNADIKEFYAGGINAAKPVTGNLSTTITGGKIDLFCGGPKFGDMSTGKTVTTNATSCEFGTFFGAGYGGNSYSRQAPRNHNNMINFPHNDGQAGNDASWNAWLGRFYTQDYSGTYGGVSTQFSYQFLPMSSNADNCGRIFVEYVKFSLATCRNVTSTLTGCKITGNFYGGGSLGKVDGPATSTLTNCEVQGSVFGAGFSASLPSVEVDQIGFATEPYYYEGLGTYRNGVKGPTTTYTWQKKTGDSWVDNTNHILYTDEDLTSLGTVTGNVTLTIDGNTVADENGKVMKVEHSVYGGGEESAVNGNTSVTVTGGTIGTANEGGAEYGNVFGGGKGKEDDVTAGIVKGSTTVSISGSPVILHNVYGGGAYGSVGTFSYDATGFPTGWTTTENKGKCTVSITGGTFGSTGKENGMVFGSSRGLEGNPETNTNVDKMAWVYDTDVTIGTQNAESNANPWIKGSVYGGGENGHNFHDAKVTVYSGTIGIAEGSAIVDDGGTPDDPSDDISYAGARYPNRGNVYGSGCGTDTYTGTDSKTYFNFSAGIVRGNTTVLIKGGHVVHNVYGGGAMGSVGTYNTFNDNGKPISCAENTGTCTVTVSGGQIGVAGAKMAGYGKGGPDDFGHVYGAGRGEMHDPNLYPNLETCAYFNKTVLTISGSAFLTGSAYGGSESGHVLGDTDVTISGGQIGCGREATAPFDNSVWADDYVPTASVNLDCASWPFNAPYASYDPYANASGDLDKYPNGTSTEGGRLEASDGHTYYGNVFGGGSGSVPYFDATAGISKYLSTAGSVEGKTKVTISGGHIITNVYGGCEATNVKGSATIKMTGGTVGVPRTVAQIVDHPLTGYIFGAGKGDQRIFFNKETNVDRTEVNIEGGRVYGSIFGGGEDGHVFQNTTVTIGKDNDDTEGPMIGTWGTSYVDGNVFGGGRGFSGEALTAGNIGGCVELNIKSGKILGSVYGGGRLASVGYGLYLTSEEGYGILRPDDEYDGSYPNPSTQEASAYYNNGRGYITINISGGTIGNDAEYIYEPSTEEKAAIPYTKFDYQNHLQYTKGGNVFTGGMGRLYALDGTTLLPLWSKLGKCKGTTLNMTGGTVKSSIYGGGEIGAVAENATVNIKGGTVGTKVVHKTSASRYYYFGSVFGGGKGSVDNITYPDGTAEADKIPISEAGTTGGNVIVNLNETVASNDDAKGAIVNQVFGCNDMNGSPKGTVTVHVYATQNADKDKISAKYDKGTEKFDVMAVYGGGNLAAYEPTDLSTGKTNVIIDGCGLTSIRQVYGGGNAASTPATDVEINGTYEILELFGGGNGADKLPTGADNPGANVGYKDYHLVENDPAYATKEARTEGAAFAPYRYGTGEATVNIKGGTIHRVFGGSNTKGNVRKTALTMLEEVTDAGEPKCEFHVDEAYGGGKSAQMDAEAKLLMACIPGLNEVYGGAEAADIHDDVTLTITNGNFNRVFGGNNISGTISGKITVNVEETGCRPVIIGELYGGGNLAAYSKYGYNDDGTPKESGENPSDDPVVNVRSFTSIGAVYGGGYGTGARMIADPTVNINESVGTPDTYPTTGDYDDNGFKGKTIKFDEGLPTEHTVTLPAHTKGKMGAIGDVFGGGNAAQVMGNTTVNIGTLSDNTFVSLDDDPATTETDESKKPVLGVDIRGNVYGGGNNAEVTGNTNVNIGKRAE